jgi:predicted  nucleic acid-binding Zn-ribbon protein
MFCTKCGFEIKDGYKFCPKCGTPAFVEKEEPKSEVKKEEVDEVVKKTNASSAVLEPVVKSTAKVKKTSKTNTASKPKKKETDTTNDNCIPNPLIEKELNIEGVKKKAEQGDKAAILRLAFMYEIGLVDKADLNISTELYTKIKDENIDYEEIDFVGISLWAQLSNSLCVKPEK